MALKYLRNVSGFLSKNVFEQKLRTIKLPKTVLVQKFPSFIPLNLQE